MNNRPTVRIRRALLVLCLCTLGGCGLSGNRHASAPIEADGRAGWALLALQNLSATPLAGQQAAALIETRLRRRGVAPLVRLDDEARPTLAALLADPDGGEAARASARARGLRYALAGSVHEWHYKAAPDREAVVGLSLRLEDLDSGQVLWQATASRTGWGRASLSSTGERVVATLLSELDIELERAR